MQQSQLKLAQHRKTINVLLFLAPLTSFCNAKGPKLNVEVQNSVEVRNSAGVRAKLDPNPQCACGNPQLWCPSMRNSIARIEFRTDAAHFEPTLRNSAESGPYSVKANRTLQNDPKATLT